MLVSPGLNSARGISDAPPLPMTQQWCAGAGLGCVLTAFGGSEGTTGALVLCQITFGILSICSEEERSLVGTLEVTVTTSATYYLSFPSLCFLTQKHA